MSGLHNLKPDRVVKAFERAGWTVERQTGSHVILSKAASPYVLSSLYAVQTIPYSQFLDLLKAGKIVEVAITANQIRGKMKVEGGTPGETKAFKTIRVDPELSTILEQYKVIFKGEIESTFLRDFFSWVFPVILFVGIWFLLMKRMGSQQAGFLTLGKNKAKIYVENELNVTFKDVAGVDEAKQELVEVVEFLKNPGKFTELGGRIPKGILLVGPPGTGKTLLAKAVAGESGVPFFSLSGSEFVEMFVGLGAARVRDLFVQAKEKAPCIIFIDELDALGKARGIGTFGGHDEREQTLNQLLVEMDGFDPKVGVILMAATNRPEILDPALLRPGRFDRHVLVDRPDKIGREEILKVHLRNIKAAEDLDLEKLANMTPGMVGADLANLVNEAALLAVRRDKKEVGMPEFGEAIERIVAGLEKKNRLINPDERKPWPTTRWVMQLWPYLSQVPIRSRNLHNSSRHCRPRLYHAGPYRGSLPHEEDRTPQQGRLPPWRQGCGRSHIRRHFHRCT